MRLHLAVTTALGCAWLGTGCCAPAEGCGQVDVSGTWTELGSQEKPSTLDIENQDATRTNVKVTWTRHDHYDGEEPALRTLMFPWDRLDAETLVTMAEYEKLDSQGDNFLERDGTRLFVQADRAYACVPQPLESWCNLHHRLDLRGTPGGSVLAGDLILVREHGDFSTSERHEAEIGRVPVRFTRNAALAAPPPCTCAGDETATSSSSSSGGSDGGF